MEDNVACPRCGATMFADDYYMRCSNPVCSYRYEAPKRIDYAQLLKNNKKMADVIREVTDVTENDTWTPKEKVSEIRTILTHYIGVE